MPRLLSDARDCLLFSHLPSVEQLTADGSIHNLGTRHAMMKSIYLKHHIQKLLQTNFVNSNKQVLLQQLMAAQIFNSLNVPAYTKF